MGLIQTYNFDNASNFNLSNAAIVANKARLALIPNPDQTFSQAFTDATGFTYDSAKAEFTAGLLRQIDQTPINSAWAATFTSAFDQVWNKVAGSLIGTLLGTPIISGGKLVCVGAQAVYFTGTTANAETHRIKFTPNYSGTPSTDVTILGAHNGTNNNNRFEFVHKATSGNIVGHIYGSSGGIVASDVLIKTAWSPVSGTEYVLDITVNSNPGSMQVHINGASNSGVVGNHVRGGLAIRYYAGALPVGANNAQGSYRDYLKFNVISLSGGTYTVVPYIYAANKVDGPNFSYSGVGTVLSVDDSTSTLSGAPRFIVGGLYHNGLAWAASNGSYAQANDFATLVANLGTFSTGGGGTLPWSIVFTDSNTLSSIDNFAVEITGQKYSPTGYLEPVQPLQIKNLLDYAHTITEGANTDLLVIIKVDGILKWFDISDDTWKTSNGTMAEANTADEINDNASLLDLGVNSSVFVRWVMSTTTNIDTPEIETASVGYDFGAIETPLSTCFVFGYLKNISDEPVVGAKVKFELNQKTDKYKEAMNNVIHTAFVEATTDVNGYFGIPLVKSSEYEDEGTQYKVTITKSNISIIKSSLGKLLIAVPDSDTKDLTDLLPVAV